MSSAILCTIFHLPEHFRSVTYGKENPFSTLTFDRGDCGGGKGKTALTHE